MNDETHHIVLYSGGLASWAAADWVVDRHTGEPITLLFTDTRIEDDDLYRFLAETVADFGDAVEFVRIADGRTPWQVFRDVKMLGNSRVDPCSRVLKRELTRDWLDEHADPDTAIIYIGFDWEEQHRLERAQPNWTPWTLKAPLVHGPPYLMREDIKEMVKGRGIEIPRLYKLGLPHNNCGGACVKAGQGHFAHLYEVLPEVYAEWERKEQEVRDELDKDVSILRDRRGGESTPLTLRELRERIENDGQVDMFSWGGCSCFMSPQKEDSQ